MSIYLDSRAATVHDYDLLVDKREIFLFGREEYVSPLEGVEPGVEFTMANRFIRNIRLLDINDRPILIHMKTNGGYWEEGMAIYQAIKTCRSHVTIINYTHARSMSSIIFQAADHRVMLPYSTFMFHDGTWGFHGTIKQALTEYEQLNITSEQMYEIYINKIKHSKEFLDKSDFQIKKWLRTQMDKKEEVYLDPQRTVELNLADEILHDYDLTRIHGVQ